MHVVLYRVVGRTHMIKSVRPILTFFPLKEKEELSQEGFEPTHHCSLNECSTTELLRQLSDCGSN